MVSAVYGTRLLALFAVTLYILPVIYSLSIPPQTIKTIQQRDDSSEETSTTPGLNDTNNGFDDLVLDDNTDLDTDNNPKGNISDKRRPVIEVIDILFRPFRPPSIFVLDLVPKSNVTDNTTDSSSEETSSSGSSEVNSGKFKGTSTPSNNNITSSEENSQEAHGGIINSVSINSDDSTNVRSSTANRDDGVPSHKPRIGFIGQKSDPTSQMTSSSLNAQKHFSMDNNENSNDDARGTSDKPNSPADAGSNDDETSSTPLSIEDITFTTSAPPTKTNGNSDGSNDDNNNQRRKRETHQMGNISNEDHDHDDSPSSSSPSKKITGKFQPDDMAKSNNSDNVSSSNGADSSTRRTSSSDDASTDDDNDTKEDDGQHETADGHKSGTVKVFLEILQLIPLSNSSTLTTTNGSSNDDDDDDDQESSSPFTPSVTTTLPSSTDNMEDTSTTATVVHSVKANSNQKISSANSPQPAEVPSEKKQPEKTHEVVAASRKRAARSVTAKPESEKKGNPSTSPTTSASPSSTTTSKPLAAKNAPAAPSPSANTLVTATKKATSTAPQVPDEPGPLVVPPQTGKSDDD